LELDIKEVEFIEPEFIKGVIPNALVPNALVPNFINPSGHPSNELYVIGVTGKNGKTTVTYLIGEVLKVAGHKPFVLGTLNSGNNDLSTPKPSDISNFMRAHLD
jgi:hypothetical protein